MSAPTITRLRPEAPAPVETPQCCVEIYRNPAVPRVYWAHRQRMDEPKGFDSKRCARWATYEIDGGHYCSLHAGQLALALLLQAPA